MNRRKQDKPFGGRIITPEWLPNPDSPSTDKTVRLDKIHLPAHQPRRYFDPQALAQLTESVKQHGILQPLLVRPHPIEGYELVAGERRYRAAQASGLESVPVVIRELTNIEAFQLALVENLQREDLNPVEETEGILQLLALQLNKPASAIPALLRQMLNAAARSTPSKPGQDGNATDNNVIITNQADSEISEPSKLEQDGSVADNNVIITNQADSEKVDSPDTHSAVMLVFDQLGSMSWRSFVTNRLPLLNLPEEILQALRQGNLDYTKAKMIARVKDAKQRQKLLKAAISKQWSLSQIKEQIQAQSKPTETLPLQEKLTSTYRQIKKARIWEDSEKSQQLEALLNEIQSLLSSS